MTGAEPGDERTRRGAGLTTLAGSSPDDALTGEREGPAPSSVASSLVAGGWRDRPTGDPASFRDPAGLVFHREGIVYRQVHRAAAAAWGRLRASGFLDQLVADGLVLPVREVSLELRADDRAVAVLQPEPLEFVSYPYEWTFGQLKDAALLTLEIQARALRAGFTLRDASPFNVQFHRGRPVLIDHLSLGILDPARPWIAYRQFCEGFLAPLALMAYRDPRLVLLGRPLIDGVPLELASRLLPRRTLLRPGLVAHLHAHARSQARFGRLGGGPSLRTDRLRLEALVDHLQRTVAALRWEPRRGPWVGYAAGAPYPPEARAAKAAAVEEAVAHAEARRVWDLGANTGEFSRLAARRGAWVLALDADPAAVEVAYRSLRRDGETRILPLVVDLANPTPSLGWGSQERRGLLERANADLVLVLALVHHLVIGRNIPWDRVADLLARLARWALVEFVPPSDPMASRLLAGRDELATEYSEAAFLAAFAGPFSSVARWDLPGSSRRLYLFRRQ
jgi:SAM-dependent methyltransferase